jgi:hypothetical protein
LVPSLTACRGIGSYYERNFGGASWPVLLANALWPAENSIAADLAASLSPAGETGLREPTLQPLNTSK